MKLFYALQQDKIKSKEKMFDAFLMLLVWILFFVVGFFVSIGFYVANNPY